MKKTTKIILICVSILLSFLLTVYLFLGFMSEKPGINGFAVTNGMIELFISGEDYVKVGEHRYLYRFGSLGTLIENEYDSYDVKKDRIGEFELGFEYSHPLPELGHYYAKDGKYGDHYLLKLAFVLKDGNSYDPGGVQVWGPMTDVYSVYFKPYDE